MSIEVSRLIEERRELQADLARIVQDRLNKFKDSTGISVRSVGVNMLTIREFGVREPRYVVDSVETRLFLD